MQVHWNAEVVIFLKTHSISLIFISLFIILYIPYRSLKPYLHDSTHTSIHANIFLLCFLNAHLKLYKIIESLVQKVEIS